MAKLMKANLYRILHSKITIILLIASCLFAFDSADLKTQNELLRYSRSKILSSRMILYYILCIAVHAGLLIYGLMSDKYVNLEMYSTELLVKNAALSIMIGLSRSASVFLIFCLCRNAIIGGVASVAAFLIVGKSSRILNYAPIMEVNRSFFTAAGEADLLKWAIVSVAYVVVFTVLAFVVFKRKEFR